MLVVGIGASAGGLEALSELLKTIPATAELALVVMQHLASTSASLLVELLQHTTALPVEWAQDGQPLRARRVYVAPPGQMVSFAGGSIRLAPSTKRHTDGVDDFLRALAGAYAHCAVAVILSGNGSDGAAGVRAVKGGGGIVFAQRLSTAQFASMPRAAADTGCVDRSLAPAEIGAELVRLSEQSRATWERLAQADASTANDPDARHLAAILRLVAAHTGVDYSVYKPNTIRRRLGRRMMLLKTPAMGDYLKLLQKEPEEIAQLHESMLINVTEFFRDPDCFEFLRANVLPGIVREHEDGSPIRLWVPGCATGEEAYSYGILLREIMEEEGRLVPVQIFGTDVSDTAIAHARNALFSASDVREIPPQRLARFFEQSDRGFVVRKQVRDMCVFARQNVHKHAPFSRLDLLSCRNLLIYFAAATQKKLMPLFHYALKPHGILVLGHSESVSGHSELFRPLDLRYRIYARRSGTRDAIFSFAVESQSHAEHKPASRPPPMSETPRDSFDAIREADRIVAARRGPPGLVLNDTMDIVQFRGEVMPFLAPVPGRASLKLLDMAREGLAIELQMLMDEARKKGVRVHRAGLSIMQGGAALKISIEVTPFGSLQSGERYYLLEFLADQTLPPALPVPASGTPEGDAAAYLAQIAQLRQDLEATRSYLQSTIEKHEATNQDLRAANEEVQSSNEELQSTNEELETAKEELQSTNEELSTVNDELHHRHVALVQANNDLSNLIGSMHLPILILGPDLNIRRFTPAAEQVFNLIPSDVGRPFTDINHNLKMGEDLAGRVRETMHALTTSEFEVQDRRGRWYALRLRPYKTSENKIEGVVLTLIDIDQMKRTIAEIGASRDFERAVFETTREPLAVVDHELRIRGANRAFYALFGLEREVPEGRSLLDATGAHGTFAPMQKILSEILPTSTGLTDHEVEIELAPGRTAGFLLNARPIVGDRPYPLFLLSLHQVR